MAPRTRQVLLILLATVSGVALVLAIAWGTREHEGAPTAPTGTPAREVLELQVGVPQACAAGLFILGRDRGLFDAEGLRVDLVQHVRGEQALRAMLDGEAELAVVNDLTVAPQALHGRNVRVIASVARDTFDRWIVAKPGLESPGALRGKRVGVQRGAGSHYVLDRLLSKSGVASADVEVVDMPVSEMPRALAVGRVDAFVSDLAYARPARERYGMDLVELGGDAAHRLRFLAVAMDRWVSESPEAIARLARGLVAADEAWRADPARASREVADAFLLHKDRTTLDCKMRTPRLELDAPVRATLEDEMKWLAEHGDPPGKEPPPIQDVVHDAPLRAAAPALVTD